MNAHEMIDRYVHQVAEKLPANIRADIQLELHSLLSDKLERQAEKAGQAPDAEMAAALLREFGSPAAVATGYRGEEYLIGPTLYPTFKTVALISLAVIGGLFLAGFSILTLWLREPLTLALVGGILKSFGGAAAGTLGGLVIIFALLERLPRSKWQGVEEWDPYSLPAVETKDDYSPVELALGVILPLLAIIVFTVYPHWVIDMESSPGYPLVPLLDRTFLVHVPWLTVLWGLEMALRLFVLGQGRWTVATRWAEYTHSLFGLYVAVRILWSSPITINAGLDILVRIGLGIAVLVGAISAVAQPFWLVFRQQRQAVEELARVRSS